MGVDALDLERAADYRLERVIGGIAFQNKEPGIPQIADAQRESKAKQVIGKVRRVGVMFLDSQVGLVGMFRQQLASRPCLCSCSAWGFSYSYRIPVQTTTRMMKQEGSR